MKLKSPWRYSKSELRSALLFHGSSEPWRTPAPRGGGYDGVFWTTEDPLTAQTYIPDWGGKALVGFNRWDLDETVRPNRNSPLWTIAQSLGAGAEVHEYDLDRATCWRETGARVTYRDVARALADLGYEAEEGQYRYWVKMTDEHIIPASKTPNGRLILVEPAADLFKHDMAGDADPDLTDLQYHEIKSFKDAFAAGFDAVIINDFAQSPRLGNIGHRAIGFSQAAIERIHREGRTLAIPATHRDFSWPMGRYPDDFSTEDFDHWHFTEVCRAIALGEQVSARALMGHEERFSALQKQNSNQPLTISSGIDSLEIPPTWRPERSSEARTETLHGAICRSEEVDAAPAHRDAQGKLLLECLDGDFGAALRRSGLAARTAFTLDDGAGKPILAGEFSARLESLVQQQAPEHEPMAP